MQLLQETLNQITPLDREAMAKTQQRLDSLTKPPGSLGVLEEIALKLAGITGNPMPKLGKKTVTVFAGDHGVTDEGVSAFPKEVTPQMVLNFVHGGAAINVLCRHVEAEVVVADLGVAAPIDEPSVLPYKVKFGTDNFVKGPAMSREEAVQALEAGITIARKQIEAGATLLGTGDMGIGNTTSSAALLSVLGDCSVEMATGRGTGIDDAGWQNKVRVIKEGIAVNRPDPSDPVDVLAKVGGFEIAGIAGYILGAAAAKTPVIVDGFISTAAALVAGKICPLAKDYMLPSHASEEPGHRLMLERLGLSPILHLKMRLGEGTGAALAMDLVEASVKILHEMATFADAGVSNKE